MRNIRAETRRVVARTLIVPTALGLAAGSILIMDTKIGLAADEEKPPEIIAAHIRDQGFECGKPESAKRDKEASRPDEPVWILTCDNATYRVREIADQAAKVERLE